MRYVTHCPSCGTAYKIVDDQLRIAQGWVRCGQCQAVYKAEETLSPLTEAEPAAEQPPIPAVPTKLAPDKTDSVSTRSHQPPAPSSGEQQPHTAAPAHADEAWPSKPEDPAAADSKPQTASTATGTDNMLARIAAIVAAKKPPCNKLKAPKRPLPLQTKPDSQRQLPTQAN